MERDFRIERLRSHGVARMRRLNALFGEAFEDPDSYLSRPPSDEYMAGLLESESLFALVAHDDDGSGDLIGGLTAYELRKLEQQRSEIYIYDLAVRERARRRGVATALIATLQEIARERGAWVVFVQADHGDDAAIALYTKLGTREDVLHFDIALDDHDT